MDQAARHRARLRSGQARARHRRPDLARLPIAIWRSLFRKTARQSGRRHGLCHRPRFLRTQRLSRLGKPRPHPARAAVPAVSWPAHPPRPGHPDRTDGARARPPRHRAAPTRLFRQPDATYISRRHHRHGPAGTPRRLRHPAAARHRQWPTLVHLLRAPMLWAARPPRPGRDRRPPARVAHRLAPPRRVRDLARHRPTHTARQRVQRLRHPGAGILRRCAGFRMAGPDPRAALVLPRGTRRLCRHRAAGTGPRLPLRRPGADLCHHLSRPPQSRPPAIPDGW